LLSQLLQLNCHQHGVDLHAQGNELLQTTCSEMQLSHDQAVNYLVTIAHSLAVFREREVSVAYLLRRTLLGTTAVSQHRLPADKIKDNDNSNSNNNTYTGRAGVKDGVFKDEAEVAEGTGPLLPFDSLLNEVSLPHRLLIARAYSNHLLRSLPTTTGPTTNATATTTRYTDINTRSITKPKMKIGFISCDFNDHPTAHLVEGIFDVVQQYRSSSDAGAGGRGMFATELVAFSYGVRE
jgi:hypothetical protein